MSVLLVLIPDRITDILVKGEYPPRYYNPGEVFDEVHILTTCDDRAALSRVQLTVGSARLTLHNHPDDYRIIYQDWERDECRRLKEWAEPVVALAGRIDPDLIRCHGADWNIYVAHRIKQTLGTPYVVSLHINPDVNPCRRTLGSNLTPEQERINRFYTHIEQTGLCDADLVMPVYRPILPYLDRLGVERVEVCYNLLNRDHLREKTDYDLHDPPRLLSVGRLIPEKNPACLIRAVASLPGVQLTVVGDGPLRAALEALSQTLGVADRVRFRPVVPNDELCATLPDFDLFATHSDYFEISKSVLEPLVTGLPVVINRRPGAPVPELTDEIAVLVDNTVDGYRHAIVHLLTDHAARAALGRRALAHSRRVWSPAATEARFAEIYRQYRRRPPADQAAGGSVK